MPLASFKIQNYILPLGLALIILLMVFTAFMTATQIEANHKKITIVQTQTNTKNNLLNTMSNSVMQRSIILVELSHNRDPDKTIDLMTELLEEANRFTETKEQFASLDISEDEQKLIFMQTLLDKENRTSTKNLIDLLIDRKHEQASKILNSQSLPLIKHVLEVIDNLYTETQNKAQTKTHEIEELSDQEVKSILHFNLLSILVCFLLMLYLIRKQRQSDSDLSLLANTDTLTKLSNRDDFIKNINHTLLKEKAINSYFSIIFFDIDYFKSINDMYGHEVGDKVLKLFCQTIESVISPDDILSRFGGDEFVLLLKNTDNINDTTRLIDKLSYELDTSYIIDNNEVFISASIGASNYPTDGDTAQKLLKHADIAMYAAKQAGRNCYQFYSLENSNKLDHEHTISHALQTILKNNNKDDELFLLYQPLVNIANENFNECEALIRWKDQDGQLINTADFIEIAEKSNLIQKVNMFVIEQACKQQFEWQQQDINNIRININLSGNKRIFKKLFQSFSENLKKFNLSPELFGIELTERTMYDISEDTYKDLDHFRSLGMKIAIDDFGTGYSSLSYLKELPITTLKIDREFMVGVPHEKIDVALVKTIITLAHSLDFDVIAEGVETQEQFDFLKSYNCNTAQGYLLHRPLSSEDITQLKLVV